MESEFLVHVNAERGYIEGLHPIRSKHVVDRLHEFLPVDNTAISVIKIAGKADLPVLFSHLPEFNLNSDEFFRNIVEVLWDKNDLSNYIPAIQGLFSGSVMQYYLSNQPAFDDANAHGGLFVISTEICPFATFTEFGVSIDTLDKMQEMFPDNKNIEYLCELRDRIPACNLQKTFVYAFCNCLYRKLLPLSFAEIKDIASYASISEWIYNINSEFNLSASISLDNIWIEPEKLTLECISTLMYISYCGNKDVYMGFVGRNLKRILTYLKQQTKSHKIFIDSEKNAIHVEYILRLRNIKTGNEQSVSRLKYVCRTLPIFDLYCADALKPTFSLLSAYTVPEDAHKEMPIRNIVIMFHQNLTSLWNKTIMVNAFIIRFFAALMGNVFIQLLLIAVCADMVFGSLRAAKYRKWNSAVGIDGAIRKAGMLACVLLFTAIDMMMHVDVLGWLPVDTRNVLDACGVVKMGVTELFALLFILYEATSVLKNMLLCGLPVPAGLREKLGAWLSTMTEETNVDIVAEKATTAPMEDVATAAAVRRTYEDDREESGLLDM